MNPETLFSIANTAVLPGWVLLVFLPRWRGSARLVSAVVIPGLLAILYSYLIGTNIFGAEGGFGSLPGVAQMFENRNLLLAGWVHYLAFDLFVGAWEVRDAQRSGVHHLLVVPCLILTLMLGPTGLLLYLAIRAVRRGGAFGNRVTIDEAAS